VIHVLPGDCREVLATLPADSVDACVLRASVSGLVTVSTSPSRMKARHSASFTRLATR
jgi:hypothetical protein